MVFVTSVCSHSQMLPEASELPVTTFASFLMSVFDKRAFKQMSWQLTHGVCALASKIKLSRVYNKASQFYQVKLNGTLLKESFSMKM